MIGEPRICVDCDNCHTEDWFEMTALAARSWDDRNLAKAMKRLGWIVDGDHTYCCEECAAEAKATRAA